MKLLDAIILTATVIGSMAIGVFIGGMAHERAMAREIDKQEPIKLNGRQYHCRLDFRLTAESLDVLIEYHKLSSLILDQQREAP